MLTNTEESTTKDFKYLVWACLLMLVLVFALHPRGGHMDDIAYWVTWIDHLKQNGFANAYSGSTINYSPGYLYLLKFFSLLFKESANTWEKIHWLRVLIFLFDIAGVLLAGFLLKKHGRSPILALFILLNLGYLYNTIIWGQVDTLHTFFAVAAIVLAVYKRPVLASLLITVSILIKLQAVIFLPLLFIVLLPQVIRNPKYLLYIFFTVVGVALLFYLPFILSGQFSNALAVITNSVDFNPVVSMAAYNLWYLFFKGNLYLLPDRTEYLGIAYKTWGLFLFCFSSAVVLLPAALSAITQSVKQAKQITFNMAQVCLAGALIAICFFYFNTQMHERYSHPVVLFAAIYALLARDYFFLILVSVAYLLNLEGVLQHLKLYDHPTLIFDPRFISGLFLLALIWGTIRLYRISSVKKEALLILNRLSGKPQLAEA